MPSGEHLKTSDPKPNGQLYKNSLLQELFAEGPGDPDALFNGKDPNLQVLHEKPEHRYLLWMKAQGASNKEIAEQSGYTQSWLSQLFRQPWAQARLVKMLSESGKPVLDRTLELIQAEAVNSVSKLISIRDDPEAPFAVQRACCVDLIEQFLGKPKQKLDVNQTEQKESLDDIDKRLAELESQERQLRGGMISA
jgi:predicted XRE-type DNA-binding protein